MNIVKEKIQLPDMLVVLAPYNAPADAAKVGVKMLEGIMAAKQKDHAKAIRLLNEAVVQEDAMIYNEPKDWLLPVRAYLGTVLLQAGNATKAAVFTEDLKENPNNHWSLYGLYKALHQQQKTAAAKAIKKQFNTAFEDADIGPGVLLF